MTRFHSTFPLFPTDDGWPYPDRGGTHEPASDDDVDLDALELTADRHAFDGLSTAERDLLSRRFGFAGPPESMKQLARHLGCTHAEATAVLGSAIAKVRARLTST